MTSQEAVDMYNQLEKSTNDYINDEFDAEEAEEMAFLDTVIDRDDLFPTD